MDVDKLSKVFVSQDGINPLDYEGTGNYSMSQEEFYLKLFTHRKADVPNPNLIFFMSDFEPKKKLEMNEDLQKTYVMGTSSV